MITINDNHNNTATANRRQEHGECRPSSSRTWSPNWSAVIVSSVFRQILASVKTAGTRPNQHNADKLDRVKGYGVRWSQQKSQSLLRLTSHLYPSCNRFTATEVKQKDSLFPLLFTMTMDEVLGLSTPQLGYQFHDSLIDDFALAENWMCRNATALTYVYRFIFVVSPVNHQSSIYTGGRRHNISDSHPPSLNSIRCNMLEEAVNWTSRHLLDVLFDKKASLLVPV
ncbi:hypothetical protein CLF_105803 [Clonorchis sinensis]|uniref:Uncharacterized protein n=1 Tax=Clonorchis sinensis TaxID=79923 RepID=G7YE83_CLOSI|nr:hypothetical protein CLF_105803 [Clonorchis sinensis]